MNIRRVAPVSLTVPSHAVGSGRRPDARNAPPRRTRPVPQADPSLIKIMAIVREFPWNSEGISHGFPLFLMVKSIVNANFFGDFPIAKKQKDSTSHPVGWGCERWDNSVDKKPLGDQKLVIMVWCWLEDPGTPSTFLSFPLNKRWFHCGMFHCG